MAAIATKVAPVHFEDYDGADFERLVFAYLLRAHTWKSIDWYGQVGSDLGRDILGERDDGQIVCVQCVNRGRWVPRKLERDLVRALAATGGRINRYLVVTRTSVSARQRDHLYVFASSRQVAACEVWSGREFEERLRANAESLLRRFVNGEAFPDAVADLAALAKPPISPDEHLLEYLPRLFDRPAFYTPFHQENSIEDFRGALTSTIEALNTGIHRLRDGTVIQRTLSRHDVEDARLRDALRALELDVARLRARYDDLVLSGEITSCSGGRLGPAASHFHASFRASHELDCMRSEVLERVRAFVPDFNVHLRPW